LTNKTPKSDSRVVTQEHEVDLSRATYSSQLSSASIDDETQSFHITIDKILYKHPVEVIEAVLHANGFSLNLENILACMDDFKIGASVQLGQGFEDQSSEPTSYIHCLQFRLPQKTAVGPTLSKFYAEIDSYESIIADLKGDPVSRSSYARREQENQDKIDTLTAENNLLRAELKALRNHLDRVTQSNEMANQALESQNILPSNVRLATVREVNLEDRVIFLKSAQTTLSLPLIMCNILPEPGDRCLVHIEQGSTLGCFFFDDRREPLQAQLARVVLVKDDLCKIRDENRNTWVIKAKNDTELKFFRKLNSNDSLLLYLLDSRPLRFEALLRPLVSAHADFVQEAMLIFQIENMDGNVQSRQNTTIDGTR
jgi:hypothetical protein